jgi:uncharacterized protein (DUF849 family)
MAEKLIITAALTGSVTVPTQTPHLPYTPEQIAGDAEACAQAGAAAVHIHARDPENGAPSSDPELLREIAAAIKQRSDIVVGITTGGGMGMSPEERLRPVALCQPEVASFNLGSMNFAIHPLARRIKPEDWRFDWERAHVEGSKHFIFANTFGSMEVFAQTMAQHNIRPEFEAYDVGHLHNLKFLEKEGLVTGPYWIQFVLGVLGGLSATPESLMMMKETADRLFGQAGYRWSVIGVGYPAEFNMAAMAIVMGGHVRVGLEDNLFVRRRQLATNAELVAKVVRLADELERELATPGEARALLGLKGSAAVQF